MWSPLLVQQVQLLVPTVLNILLKAMGVGLPTTLNGVQRLTVRVVCRGPWRTVGCSGPVILLKQ